MPGPGRIHTRLAEMLSKELGVEVKAADFSAVTGHWRTSRFADVLRWDGFIKLDGISASIGSWDPMSHCVRYGFTISRGRNQEATILVNAKSPSRLADRR